ncbi:diguanylate cyclase domain-containing protein [Alteromonas antoniana]|uniref:diguanylate cyclase domain-containing protein n=1 Tax=Alteromonas antoniana TaxID=2803813 RepID=UPI001C465825|nr:diguanylate cyclase [Alteromonas antoniana]
MTPLKRRLYVRVAVELALLALAVSLVMATAAYWLSLAQQRDVNRQLVVQLAESAQNTSAIAAYLADEELAQEILNGLVANNLVEGARIEVAEGRVIRSGISDGNEDAIVIPLSDPFLKEDRVGRLVVLPDDRFIQAQAQKIGLQAVVGLIALSILIALAVSMLVHKRLTSPLRRLTRAFESVDVGQPESMQELDIGYQGKDELGVMIARINALMAAQKDTLLKERQLRERTERLEQRFRLIFEQASAAIGLITANGKLLTTNSAFTAMFSPAEEDPQFAALFVDRERVENILQQMRSVEFLDHMSVDLEYVSGQEVKWAHCLFAKVTEQRNAARAKDDALIEVVAYDVTERIEREKKNRFEADHDALTGLLNRRSGERRLKQALATARLSGHQFVLFMIDLDNFKPVNDTFGHDAGDEVLVAISKRIKGLLNLDKDICIRWGGDEFVVAFVDHHDHTQAISRLAQSILDEFRVPIPINSGDSCEIGASIGIVLAPQHGDTIEQLLAKADNMMYDVKQTGRNFYKIAAG